MLLSLTKKFLFIANLKTASTSIERVLSSHCELRLLQSQFGKHLTFAEFADRFHWLLGIANMQELFIFGVIRDPVDFTLSLYNSHKREQFKDNPRLYTGGMDFAQFISQWVPRNADQIKNQCVRFLGSEGRLITNFLISYDKLDAGLEIVANRIGVPELKNIPRTNPSPEGKLRREDLTPVQIDWIEQRFKRDRDFIARHADRLIEF